MNFSFYKVDSEYCNFLRETDRRVPYTMEQKSTRPFVGIVFAVNGFHYYAPLTSPKPKHLHMKNQIDFLKIQGGEWGAVNFNNMIPVPLENLTKIEMRITNADTKADVDYKNLLANQLSWCNSHKETILKQARKLYDAVTQGRARENLLNRCCNFRLLETQCSVYEQAQVEVIEGQSDDGQSMILS